MLVNACLQIDELCARVFLGNNSGDDKLDEWYFNSGTTHDMTRRQELFSNLDRGVGGSIKFGNSSLVEICGIGSIMFEAKTSEHRVLHGVYYIPALCNSIINLDQLDKGGSLMEVDRGSEFGTAVVTSSLRLAAGSIVSMCCTWRWLGHSTSPLVATRC